MLYRLSYLASADEFSAAKRRLSRPKLESVILTLRYATCGRELRENQLCLLPAPAKRAGDVGGRYLVRSGKHGERKLTPGLVLGG